MNIVVAVKAVPEDQDIKVAADRTLDYSKAKEVISAYDTNALEAASQLAAGTDARVVAVSVGGSKVDDSKLKKNILARGAQELFMVADDACADLDAHATAGVLSELVEKSGGADVIICGDGSADNYAQQVDVQLAAKLGWPVITAVTKLGLEGDFLVAERVLEDETESVRVALPAVVSVVPDIAVPKIPGMKDILAAGKKPMNVEAAGEVAASSLETVSCLAPQQADRKLQIMDASEDAINTVAAAIKAAL